MNPTAYQELSRKIFVNDKHKTALLRYSTNLIKTRKYTLWNFFPKALYLQFLRIANVYFLVIAICSSFDEISPVTPITSVIPLVIVLGTSMLREAIEDWGRFKNDRLINNQKTMVHRLQKCKGTQFADVNWSELVVGDIIKIQNNEEIPADVVLLTSNDENGLAYVETANLDGEKNLKLKQSNVDIHELINNIGLDNITGAMLVDTPNAKIHKFRGVIELESIETQYLNYNNLMLRGTFLKNTEYVYGMVVYTGHDTKLMKNQGTFRNKKSHIEKMLNKYIVGVFFAQMTLCVLLTLLAKVFRTEYLEYEQSHGEGKLSYLFPEESTGQDRGDFADGLITFASFLLLLNTMIPISLIVSLELAKFFQTKGIDFDQLIWDEDHQSKCFNMLIHEDLAKVEYIFADKTGTLTTNEMRFQACSINGIVYTKEDLLNMKDMSPKKESRNGMRPPSRPGSRLQTFQSHQETRNPEDDTFTMFWLAMTLCHEVIIDSRHADSKEPREKYQGSSPDEVELVSTSCELGYIFQEKRGDIYSLNFNGKYRDFQMLTKIDFNSDRKRMSVVMRDIKTEKLYLFCKGADNIMMKRMKIDTPLFFMEKTKDDLNNFSCDGLRTLVIGYKELDEEEFLAWNDKHYNAQLGEFNVLTDDDPQAALGKIEDEIETNLTLLGATALEDKLQDGVSETIIDFHKAGIKIWMLTGDKLETAENIGHATNLIAKDTKVFKIRTHDVESTMERFIKISNKIEEIRKGVKNPVELSEQLEKLENLTPDHEEDEDASPEEETICYKSFALIIDGDAINYTFQNDGLKKLFIDLIPQFRTVICCRSTPSQKADVVTFVKTNLNKMTLAIGDGGNDVNMIQRADIGVGIFGKEGHQAAFASDYAFGKFMFLWRLLLVHGRWSYIRTTGFINFFFYKNLIFTLPQFWFAIYSGYSGQSIYDDVYITNYNTVFTSVAPVYYASLFQDINPRENETIRKAMPYVYAEFRRKNLFSLKRFLFWWLIACIHSLLVFYATKQTFSEIADQDGKTFDIWRESIATTSGVFFAVFLIILMGSDHFDVFTLFCYGVCTFLVFFPAGTYVMDNISSTIKNILTDIIGTLRFWIMIVFTTTACSLFVYIPKQLMSFFDPSLVDLLQRDRNNRWKKQKCKKVCKEEEKCVEMKTPEEKKKFDFDQHIMFKGYYPNT